jgi:hypothetical protein
MLFWTAFHVLSAMRQEAAPICLREFLDYCRLTGVVSPDLRAQLFRIVPRMDAALMEASREANQAGDG